jgi:hypothetical protein
MDAEKSVMIKFCPKCNASFSCNPVACWCSELPAVMPMDINAECYCPECLGKIIEAKLTGVK